VFILQFVLLTGNERRQIYNQFRGMRTGREDDVSIGC